MCLVHHVAPFAVGDGIVVPSGDGRIFLEEGAGSCGEGVGEDPVLSCVAAVEGDGVIEFVEVGAGEDGVADQLVVGVFVLWRQEGCDAVCVACEAEVVGGDDLGFAVVVEAVGIGGEEFGFAAGVVMGVFVEDIGDGFCMCGSELYDGPILGIPIESIGGIAVGVPCVVEEEFDGGQLPDIAPIVVAEEEGDVVGDAHADCHDAVFVGEDGVEGIVGIEGITPHGGPQVVGFAAEEEFEYFFVECMVGEREMCFMGDRDIGPPVPGRDAEAFGEFEDAIGCASSVATGDGECFCYSREGFVEDAEREGFPFVFDGRIGDRVPMMMMCCALAGRAWRIVGVVPVRAVMSFARSSAVCWTSQGSLGET